jgi:hypothetical protein
VNVSLNSFDEFPPTSKVEAPRIKHAGSVALAPSSCQVAVKRCPIRDQFLRGIIIDLAFLAIAVS